MPTRSLLCHKRRKLPIYTKPLFLQIPGPCCGTVWGAVTPPLYPALFSTPRLTPIGREIPSNYRVSRLGHKAPAGRRRGGYCPTAAHRGAQAGHEGDCPFRSVGPAPFSLFFHRAAQNSIRCRRGRFPLPHGRGRPSQFRFQIVGSSVMITSFL